MGKDWMSLIVIGLLLYLVLGRRQPAQVNNEETWVWTDWQKNKRSITVHRDVQST